MATDAFVQVAPNSVGSANLIDNSTVVNNAGSTVFRQRVNISDPVNPNQHSTVDQLGNQWTTDISLSALMQMLIVEVRITNELLREGLTLNAQFPDLELFRKGPVFSLVQ